MLNDLRVLDVTGSEAAFLGKFFADFGADVIYVPTQIQDRMRVRLDSSGEDAYFVARHLNKRILSSSVEAEELLQLASSADLVLTSDGRLQSLGIQPEDLSAAHPSAIVVNLSTFGNFGPKSSWRGSNLTLTAAGGFLTLCGEPEEAPIEVAAPQGYGQMAAQALAGAMLALNMRDMTGTGALVDVSGQEAVVNSLLSTHQTWHIERRNERRGTVRQRGNVLSRYIYRSRDGFIAWQWYVGTGFGRKTKPMVDWMEECGQANSLATVDWEGLSIFDLDQSIVDEWESAFASFLSGRSTSQIANESLKRGILLFPVQTPLEILNDYQLEDRKFFSSVDIGGGRELRVPAQYFAGTLIGSIDQQKLPEPGAESWLHSQREPSATLEASRRLPLTGMQVLDLSWQVVGPTTARYLGMYGATVIRVESRTRPDGTRLVGPYVEKPGLDRSALFANTNICKKSVSIDLKTTSGRLLAQRLAAESDIVIENFRPGVAKSMGLDYSAINELNPDVIMVSLSMQGQTGPRSSQPGLGIYLKALAGIDAESTSESGTPAGPNYAYTDLVAPWFAIAGIIMAIRQKRAGLGGAYLDISQYEASLHLMTPSLLAAQDTVGEHWLPAPYGTFPTEDHDRWLALAIWNDEEWAQFTMASSTAWNPKYSTDDYRRKNLAQLNRDVAEWTGSRSPVSLQNSLRSVGVDCHLVAEGSDLYSDPQLVARNHFVALSQEKLGTLLYDAPAFRISGCEPQMFPPPLLGQDTTSVLSELLDMSDSDISKLVEERAILAD